MQQLFGRLRATIADARTRASDGSTQGAETFLEALLRARDEQGQPHSEAQIIANSLTMLLGGQDTTANSLAWAIHYLADSPERLEQLRAEAAAAGAGLASLGSDSAQFPQSSAVASEVLRARPPVSFFSLEARQDLVVGDVFVPRGTPIQMVIRPTLERLPDGGCPSAFDPDRWLDPAREPRARQSDLAFGSGPRACPGRTLALLEMRLVLGMLSQNFTLQRVGDRDAVRERNQLTMIPDGLRVRLTPRSDVGR
jgi:cytochrome P450